VVERSEDIRTRDTFGQQRLREGRYTPGEIDRVWSAEIEADFEFPERRKNYPATATEAMQGATLDLYDRLVRHAGNAESLSKR